LYKNKPGVPQAAGATPPPPPGGEGGMPDMGGGGGMPSPPSAPPPPGPEPGGVTPESYKRDNLKILLESDGLIESDTFIDLSKAKNYLGDIENELNKLMKD
jgi:hypothetical protein